jgi:S-adenosylmethionine:tRNA ribosyltransferase-isomerase
MKLSDFDYSLAKELIAQYPLERRDAARLMVLDRQAATIEHRAFKDISQYLSKDELLVLNDTKVLPSRLKGRRLTGARVELLLLGRKEGLTFNALIKPARVKVGEKIIFNGGNISGIISARNQITFSSPEVKSVYDLGEMPLPPYIKREPQDLDSIYYQTVYAAREGAVAAPTAGLHFTRELLEEISCRGVNIAYITLHIGYATFKPVKSENLSEHKMEEEDFNIGEEAARLIDEARLKKRRIIAVGTTSCRALETYAAGISQGRTGLFIYPGYEFKLVNCLLTNFHLPRTTLFMLSCAFGGEKFIKKAYQEAIEKKYRFYSYGDAMFIT